MPSSIARRRSCSARSLSISTPVRRQPSSVMIICLGKTAPVHIIPLSFQAQGLCQNLANSSIRRDTSDTVTAVSGMIGHLHSVDWSSSASLVMLIVTIPVARSALLTKSTNNASSKRRRTFHGKLFFCPRQVQKSEDWIGRNTTTNNRSTRGFVPAHKVT